MYQPGFRGMFPSNNNFREEGIDGDSNILRVFGVGTVNAKPDKAEIGIGVITENKQLELAQRENARITQQVIDSMEDMGILKRDIQTQNYSIRTNYDYIEGKQVFRGYEVINSLKIVVRNINDVGKIIDTAVRNGANSVDNINFIVSNKSEYYNEALKLAIEDAQNKALAIGNKLKVQINITPIKIIEQGTSGAVPLSAIAFKATNESTPIEAGENKITATIEATFIYNE